MNNCLKKEKTANIQKILVVADNHGNLKSISQLIAKTKYDAIFHAGDYTCDVNELLKLHPYIYFVLGNNDNPSDYHKISSAGIYLKHDNIYLFNFSGIKFLITHGHHYIGWNLGKSYESLVDLAKKYNALFLIFAHTHIPFYKAINDIHILNPGSVNYPRSDFGKSYAEISILNNKIIAVEIKKLI